MNSPRKENKKRSILFKRISQGLLPKEEIDQFCLEVALSKNDRGGSFKKVKLSADYNDDKQEEKDLLKNFVSYMNMIKKAEIKYQASKYDLVDLNPETDDWLLGYRKKCDMLCVGKEIYKLFYF